MVPIMVYVRWTRANRQGQYYIRMLQHNIDGMLQYATYLMQPSNTRRTCASLPRFDQDMSKLQLRLLYH